MYRIDNGWQNICPICGNHNGEMVEMTINQGPLSTFYSCPKYYPQNRDENERACANRINLNDYQAMVEKLYDMIADTEFNGGRIDLTNYTWKSKGCQFRVLEHKNGKIKVEILNKKALR